MKVHSDAGPEFINDAMEQYLNEKGVWQTKTAGYDPKGNGRVERFVGILKHQSVMFLLYAKLPLCFWYWAMMQAAYEYRCKILKTLIPNNATRFRERVLIQKPLPHKSFESKVEEGIILTWDVSMTQGTGVAVTRNKKNCNTLKFIKEN